jgi:hypothetical protein
MHCKADRDTAGTGTHIKKFEILLFVICQHQLHQCLCILSRDQSMAVHKELQPHKFLRTENVLKRFAFRTSRNALMVLLKRFLCRLRTLDRTHEILHPADLERMLKEIPCI